MSRGLLAVLGTLAIMLAIGGLYRLILGAIPGVTVTSWFRSPWHNSEVGGLATSLHLIGWGFDLVPDGLTTQAQAVATGLPFLKFESEGSHLHVQIF